ncbi:hypothetical protein Q1695_002946 [Nippostrongylus brasiliensis]|nr:hypothetical protein Q1695_002946 [Nippostrongylus brasiliensis]
MKAALCRSLDTFTYSKLEDLDSGLVTNLRKMGYRRLMPVQGYATSVILEGHHVVVRAPTGSGKTAAFLIPAIEMVIRYHRNQTRRTNRPLVLILGNTQNLMEQTYKFACSIAGYDPQTKVSRTQVRILDLFGGGANLRYHQNIEHEVVVATCGALRGAQQLGKIDLSLLQFLVLDEADKMVDLRGFGYELPALIEAIPEETKEKLTVAEFSATFEEDSGKAVVLSELDELIFRGTIPVFIDLPASKGYITQRVLQKGRRKGLHHVSSFVEDLGWLVGLIEADLALHDMKKTGPFKKATVIFVERKVTSNYITVFLKQLGYCFEPMNSDYSAADNNMVLGMMKRGEIQGVVATNKMARGQDVSEVDHVIIFQMSGDFDDYKHRIGRTGRMGRGGRATVMLSLQNDGSHVIPLVDFMLYHNQGIPDWLWKEYVERKQAERREVSSFSDSFVSAGTEIIETEIEDDSESQDEPVMIHAHELSH